MHLVPKPKPTTSYSKDTQKMLDKMMNASGLPQAEQRRLRAACAAGPSAPLAARRRPAGAAQAKYEDLLQGVPINPAMNLPGAHRKTRAAILADNGGSLEREQYGGGRPVEDRAAQVERLQQQMTYGRVLGKPDGAVAAPKPQPKPVKRPEDDLRASIVSEIDERLQFVSAMRAAGKTEHEDAVLAQIAERKHDLQRLDELARSDD
jgi:hypothetical protein